jgi:hypothetical protein
MLIGFSDHTCLPAAIACDVTWAWTAGMVRFTTSSTSGWARTSPLVPHSGTSYFSACARVRAWFATAEDDHPDVRETGQVVQIGVADHPGADEAIPIGPDPDITLPFAFM